MEDDGRDIWCLTSHWLVGKSTAKTIRAQYEFLFYEDYVQDVSLRMYLIYSALSVMSSRVENK